MTTGRTAQKRQPR